MTYSHKLARRLAILRALPPHSAMLPALALIAACSAGVPTGVDTASNPADAPIAVNPRSLILEANQVSIFKAYAKGVPGDSLVTSIEWTATGGTIGLDGTYSSPSTGDFKVVGKRHGPTRTTSDTATVTVVPPQPSITSVVITPGSASVASGTQQMFSATGRLSDGSTVAIGVTWTATGGSIDAGGVYTAGSTTGTYHVVAQAASANVADTVPVTVLAPEGGSSSGQYPNLPTSLASYPLFQYDGNGIAGPCSKTATAMTFGVACGQNMNGGSASIVQPSDAPVDAPSVLDVLYPAGLPWGGEPYDLWLWKQSNGAPQVSQYYEAGWFRMGTSTGSVDWEAQSSNQVKILGYWGVGGGPGTPGADVYNTMSASPISGTTSNGNPLGRTWTLSMRAQNQVSWSLGTGGMLVTVGKWYRYELYMQLETTPGMAGPNGVMKMWLTNVTDNIGPVLILSASNLAYRSATKTAGFWQRSFVPVWGGAGSAPKSRDDHLQVARMAAWGR